MNDEELQRKADEIVGRILAGPGPANLIDRIEQEMQNDDEDRVKQSMYLRNAYKMAADEGEGCRIILDDAFIALCGYSLTTLIEEVPKDVGEFDDE